MQNLHQNKIACFTMPKIGEQEADIQDACYCSKDGSQVAIADGASTSLFPGEWAELLVKHFCNYNQDSIESIYQRWEEWLQPVQEEWRKFWLAEIQKKNATWYVKGIRKENYGSATFVGIKFRPLSETEEKLWEAIAVGDSCLFHIKARMNKFIAFPINKSENFKTVTDCFHSLYEQKSSPPKYQHGSYEEGDVFLLATDALAEWVLKELETGSARWTNLISISTPEEFQNFIQQLRGDRLIKNDDTTLCRIKVVIPEPPPPPPPPPPDNRKKQIIWAVFLGVSLAFILGVFGIFIFNSKTEDKRIAIYADDSAFSNQPIGYLWNQSFDTETLQLWVHAPKIYLEKAKSDKFFIVIPAESTPLALYTGKAIPQELLPQDFAGYLLPGGKYTAIEIPTDSKTFQNARWVKIQVRFTK